MKRIKKILIISFLWLFIITVFGVIGVEAQREIEFRPQVALPGYTPRPFGETGSTQYIAEYVVAIYRYGVSIGAILATVVLMTAGLMWLTSGGNQEKIGQAKNMISGSIIGLILLFGSYTILNTINPELVDFHIQDIDFIAELSSSCCVVRHSDINNLPTDNQGRLILSYAFLIDNKEKCDELNGMFHYGNNYIVTRRIVYGKNQVFDTCMIKEREPFCCRCGIGCVGKYCAYHTCSILMEIEFSGNGNRSQLCRSYCLQKRSTFSNVALGWTFRYFPTNEYGIGARCSNNNCSYD